MVLMKSLFEHMGTVVVYSDIDGCGLISIPGKLEGIYVYYKSISCQGFQTLFEGQPVIFELIQ